jgi:hypothetical protein
MALSTRLSVAAANAAADAMAALLDGGTFEIYSGAQPASAADAVTSQVLLAALGFGTPAFGAAVGGAAPANAITSDSDANASGNAAWYRLKTSGGDVVMDGSIGTADSNLILNSIAIVQHATVAIDAYELRQKLSE